ncbi:MAG: peptidoglycan DD-metalloendopeptidase family protein [Hydrogenophaga sp.]
MSLCLLAVALASAGCSGRRALSPAPVEDRGAMRAAAAAPRVLPGAENAGKPGYYTVQAGDTLHRIALDNGQHWRDLQNWNGLGNPNLIEVGQVLRVAPPVAPAGAAASGVTASAVSSGTVVARPLPASPTAVPPAAQAAPADTVNFVWPAQGEVISPFDEAKNKGVGIAGKPGDPVLAAADGRVVYAGAGLRRYGNLIILKHNNTYLTAYAHNQALLVREDQTVRQGQKIAEMGSSDTDRVKLHFEVRREGKPVDPLGFLPTR